MHGVFWGRFDPPTKAHLKIIHDICEKFTSVHLVIIDDPKKQSPISTAIREQWILDCLDESIINKVKFYKQCTDIKYTYVDIKKIAGDKLAVVCGDDAYATWLENNIQESKLSYDMIYVVARHEQFDNLSDNIIVAYLPSEYHAISSQQVKNAISHNQSISNQIHTKILGDVVDSYS
ncbi:MAG: adenylyltransferase/cytidyltransferase family protein [Francisellaceae bacterium]|jgi:cytidyltransferase-like protein|nr:adenylyltransferase/cytidyltransferase family protein [Francisellaceae bacterium]MBT6539612.1 adenylyltransferase/cytidyltransferase family protein [Francisellaceae bacterium]